MSYFLTTFGSNQIKYPLLSVRKSVKYNQWGVSSWKHEVRLRGTVRTHKLNHPKDPRASLMMRWTVNIIDKFPVVFTDFSSCSSPSVQSQWWQPSMEPVSGEVGHYYFRVCLDLAPHDLRGNALGCWLGASYFLTGVDLITACDIRLCTEDAWFQVKVGWSLELFLKNRKYEAR